MSSPTTLRSRSPARRPRDPRRSIERAGSRPTVDRRWVDEGEQRALRERVETLEELVA
jgi:hypothetical protein